MAEKLLLGVDLGGSSSKATLIDSQGNVLATASREYPAYSPKPGWLEQDADDLFDAVIVNIKACIEKAGIDGKAISALAIDAATHMAVLCGADDKPLRRFIHWSDARSGAQTRFLKENCSELLRESSVNSVSPAWTLPQMMWLRENEPEVIKKHSPCLLCKGLCAPPHNRGFLHRLDRSDGRDALQRSHESLGPGALRACRCFRRYAAGDQAAR